MNKKLIKSDNYDGFETESDRATSWLKGLKGLAHRGMDEAKRRLEQQVNEILSDAVDIDFRQSMWNDDEAEELESNLTALWQGVSSSEYPVFSMALGTTASLRRFLNELVGAPLSDETDHAAPKTGRSNSLFEDLFDGGWLDWRFGLGALHLIDLRSGLHGGHMKMPSTFRVADVELYFLDSDEALKTFMDLEVHGLGGVKHVYRISDSKPVMETAQNVLVVMDEASVAMTQEQREQVFEAAEQRGWSVMEFLSPGTWQGGGPGEHLAEKISLLLPRSKQGAFARLSKSEALRKAEAHEVVRFGVLMAGYAGTLALPGTVVSLMTTIHGYMLLRIAWLFGREVDASLVAESVLVAGSSVSLGYGLRALVGAATSGVPLLGKFFSSLMLGGITEELGESVISYYDALDSGESVRRRDVLRRRLTTALGFG